MSRIDINPKGSPFYTLPENPNINSDSANTLTPIISYSEKFETDEPKGINIFEGSPDGDGNGVPQVSNSPVIGHIPASSINPYFNVRLKTVRGFDYPVVDEDTKAENLRQMYQSLTVTDLVENPMGACQYSYDDFLYVRDLDKLKLNRLITLRRFAHPTFDDIFSKKVKGEPDIARAVTFSTQEVNKLSEILKFSFGLKWKPLSATSERAEMQGTNQSGVSGIMGGVLKFVDPKYGSEALAGNNIDYDPQHDSNKVYGPVDSIASTHVRDIGVIFDAGIDLEFNYEMKSINGVNQKAAFLDLITNLVVLCTNDAKFWGGSRYWVGPRPSKYMNMLRGYLHPRSWQDFTENSYNGVKTYLGSFLSGKRNAKEMLMNIVNNAMNLALGTLLNRLGRTGIPIMNSLLTGNPVGPWHLMVGNPFNPIMCVGDLILGSAELSLGDELGYDDFPTELKLKVTVQSAKPKGRAEIESMFNAGKGRIYFKPKDITRKNKPKSSAQNPIAGQVHSAQSDDNTYDYADISRNAPELWSFLKTETTDEFNSKKIQI